eukprot:TRINITY_DN11389_c0_g1_i1.p1 TRINITY_DN11389_c0_g1~~TRINITY_DN11389_c0_g1_i1.p1  ORF type:complete len:712 (-),score=84.61 TRINITY_DN11389_c0_g1_i1:23-2158(-)
MGNSNKASEHRTRDSLEKKTDSLTSLFKTARFQVIPFKDLQFDENAGSGATAIVRKAVWKDTEVAVKTYFEDQESIFKTEVQNLFELQSHPKIIKIIGICIEPPYGIVMKYIPEGSLRDFLHKKETALSWKLYILMAMDIAKALLYVHDSGFLFRDLKTSNLLVDSVSLNPDDTRILLCDFGVCKKTDLTSTMLGTPIYLPPEVNDSSQYNSSADVYSFSLVLWEMLYREVPYREFSNFLELRSAVARGIRPKLDGCPVNLANLIKLCWSQDPTKRPNFRSILKHLSTIVSEIHTYPAIETFTKLAPKKAVRSSSSLCMSLIQLLQPEICSIPEIAGLIATLKMIDNVLQHSKSSSPYWNEIQNLLVEYDKVITEAIKTQGLKSFVENWISYSELEYIDASLLCILATIPSTIVMEDLDFQNTIEDKTAKLFWKTYFRDEVMVSWELFWQSLSHYAELSLTEPNVNDCLRSVLDPADTKTITIFRLARALKFFSSLPFLEALTALYSLVSCEWFYGYTSFETARELLRFEQPGTFLLRFETAFPTRIALNYLRDDGEIQQHVVSNFTEKLIRSECVKELVTDVDKPIMGTLLYDRALFGMISYEASNELLSSQGEGTYLLRFSRSSPGKVDLAYFGKDKRTHHLLIQLDKCGTLTVDNKTYTTFEELLRKHDSIFTKRSVFSLRYHHYYKILCSIKQTLESIKRSKYDICM